MQANLPSRGKPVGRSSTFNRRSYLWWIWSQLKCAEARAYECYRMGLPGTGQPPVFLGHRSWFGTWPFPRSALGDLLRPPVVLQTPLMGPDSWGAILAQETRRTSGEAFCLSPWTMSSDDLHGQRGGSEWLKHLLVVCQVLEVPQLIQSS